MKVFTEEQQFTKHFAVIGLGVALAVSLFVLYSNWQEINQGSTSDKIGAFSGVFVILLVGLLFYYLKLKTRIDEEGIHYQFYPFHLKRKTLPWNQIKNFNVKKYNPILDYGGWGIRYSFIKRKGRAFTVSGNQGLKIELNNGKNILIGTQQPEKIQLVINHYKNKFNNEN